VALRVLLEFTIWGIKRADSTKVLFNLYGGPLNEKARHKLSYLFRAGCEIRKDGLLKALAFNTLRALRGEPAP